MLRIASVIGFDALIGAVTAVVWLLVAASGRRQELRHVWPEFYEEWTAWSAARKLVRIGLPATIFAAAIVIVALLTRLIGAGSAGLPETLGFAAFMLIWGTALVISGPFARRRQKDSHR